jgi:defect-in-organelle-trafficking protein DotC
MSIKNTLRPTILALGCALMAFSSSGNAQGVIGGLDWKEPKILVPGQGVSTPSLAAIMADSVRGGGVSSGVAEVPTIRAQAVQEAAASLGARAGLARGLSDIDASLRKQMATMDASYNFSALALSVPMRAGLPATYPAPRTGNGEYAMILPPVIVEGRDSDSFPNEDEMRIADRVYKIYNKARLVPVDKQSGRPAVPDWRDYLVFSFQEVQMPHPTLLPKNDAEKAIWNEWVNRGWQEGLIQAQQLFDGGWARLNRDYKGMLNYRLAYSQGLVTRPQVAGVNMGVTGGGTEMRLNDRTVRITDHSALVPDTSRWSTNNPK